MIALELRPDVRPEDVGYTTVTTSLTRVDRWTLHLVDTATPVDGCRMLTGDKGLHTGSTPLVGWAHEPRCPLTAALVGGRSDGWCRGGTP